MKRVLALAAVGLALLGACRSSHDDSAAKGASTTQLDPNAVTADANTASQAELLAALNARGVPDGLRWSGEIIKHRPYPKTDPSLRKLKDALAPYHLDDAVVKAIVASLHV